MNKLDYLKQATTANLHTKKDWLVRCLAITQDTDTTDTTTYPLQVHYDATGAFVLSETNEVTRITDSVAGEALFKPNSKIVVDSSLYPYLKEPTESTFGRLIVNLLCVAIPFKNKLPYVIGRFSISAIEEQVAIRLINNPEDGVFKETDSIYVDEYLTFTNSIVFLSSLSDIVAWSATDKNIVPPPGVEEYRAKLVKEYGSRLTDPVILAEFETKLKDYDEKFLTGDPSNGVFLTGKTKNMGRRKAYLTQGAEADFVSDGKVRPVIQPLYSGWTKDKQDLTNAINVSRAATYSRGKETQKGGEVQKIMLRTTSDITVTQEDCGSKLGLIRTITNETHAKFLGRSIVDKTAHTIIGLDNVSNYFGQVVKVRSAGYCLATDGVCKVCVGQNLSVGEKLVLALTELSSMILLDSMKAVHGKALSTKQVVLTDILS